jgi:FkbM family methyltransferase
MTGKRINAARLYLLRALGFYLRQTPDHPARWRLIELAVRLSSALRAARRPFVIRTREGFRIRIDGSSQTGRILFATGEYEPATTRVITHLLGPGQTMIDAGANIGYFAIVGARSVGPAGRVVAFEPASTVRECLLFNLALNHLSNVIVRDEALSASSGTAEFFTGPPNDTGLASLRALPTSGRTTVKQIRFDDLWPSFRPVAIVKMDVEGAEAAALSGMSHCLRHDRPDLIVEVTDHYLRAFGSSADALVTHLHDLDYQMYRIDHHGLFRVADSEAMATCPGQFNALFTTKDPEHLPRW